MKIYTFCPECGINVSVDEDGLCLNCGATATGRGIDDIEATRAALEELKEALAELVDLVEDTRQGEYKPDSFTCQPAKAALDRVERAEKGEG